MENSSRKWIMLCFFITGAFAAYILHNRSEVEGVKVVEPKTQIVEYTERSSTATTDKMADINATKMNVVYVGVENPIDITVTGIPSSEVKVAVSGAKIRSAGNGNYALIVDRPGMVEVKVTASDFSEVKKFRAKRIPDPVARLGEKSSGAMSVGEFQIKKGVIAALDNFDFDVNCMIQGFYLERISESGTVQIVNQGAKYTPKAQAIVDEAKPGDIFIFDKVKAKCSGDRAGRAVNSMIFRIK